MDEIYLPLLKCSIVYQNVFLDSYQEITNNIRLKSEIHELSESSQLMLDIKVGTAFTDFSLQTLLLRSVDEQFSKLK